MRAGIGIYRRRWRSPEDWLPGQRSAPLRGGVPQHPGLGERRAGGPPRGRLPALLLRRARVSRPAQNEIKLRVDSPTDNPADFPDSPFAEIPFGKQSWYGPLSGIWQSVYLERRIPDHMTRVRLVPTATRAGDRRASSSPARSTARRRSAWKCATRRAHVVPRRSRTRRVAGVDEHAVRFHGRRTCAPGRRTSPISIGSVSSSCTTANCAMRSRTISASAPSRPVMASST